MGIGFAILSTVVDASTQNEDGCVSFRHLALHNWLP